MAKYITLTQQVIDDLKAAFEKRLSSIRISDGKFTFEQEVGSVDGKATVYFSAIAWVKMATLVDRCSSEIAWHGLARRGDDPEKNEYIVDDILVYPQIVSGATVESSPKYNDWHKNLDPETFKRIGMQGHSHVDFAASPSGTDLTLYKETLASLPSKRFYIFLILNKRKEMWIEVYDMLKNIHFENKDMEYGILPDQFDLEAFCDSAFDMLEKKTYTQPAVPTYGNTYGSTYGGNYGYSYPKYGASYGYKTQESPKKDSNQKDKKEDRKGKRAMPSGWDDEYYYCDGRDW